MGIANKYELQLGPFSCVALKLDYGEITIHKDEKDVQDGYCWVLNFPKLNISVDSKPGDITGFLASALEHQVTSYSGFRYYLTCFTHQQDFFSPSNEKDWGNYGACIFFNRFLIVVDDSFPCM